MVDSGLHLFAQSNWTASLMHFSSICSTELFVASFLSPSMSSTEHRLLQKPGRRFLWLLEPLFKIFILHF